jgi:hypothetical protein
MNLRNTVLAVTLVSIFALPAAHAEHGGYSGLSPSETVVLSVVVSPILVAGSVVAMGHAGVEASGKGIEASGKGIKASTGASNRFSESLSTHTDWTVVGLRNQRDTTQLELESTDGTMRMTVGVPTRDVNARGIRLQDHITMKQLGTDSFTAEFQGKPLGVVSDPAANLAHSHKRN